MIICFGFILFSGVTYNVFSQNNIHHDYIVRIDTIREQCYTWQMAVERSLFRESSAKVKMVFSKKVESGRFTQNTNRIVTDYIFHVPSYFSFGLYQLFKRENFKLDSIAHKTTFSFIAKLPQGFYSLHFISGKNRPENGKDVLVPQIGKVTPPCYPNENPKAELEDFGLSDKFMFQFNPEDDVRINFFNDEEFGLGVRMEGKDTTMVMVKKIISNMVILPGVPFSVQNDTIQTMERSVMVYRVLFNSDLLPRECSFFKNDTIHVFDFERFPNIGTYSVFKIHFDERRELLRSMPIEQFIPMHMLNDE